MEEEIDLRQYVEVLLKYKFWILGLTILAAIVAFIIGSRKPLSYQAEASLAMLRVRSEVAFEPKFVTTADDASSNANQASRRETLAALAASSSVAAMVSQQMGDRLSGVADRVEDLQGMVAVANEGDLILIRATNGNPKLASDIANAWAGQAEAFINSIFGQPSQQTLELQAQFQEVQAKYGAAQSDLETFLAQNRVPELQREVKHREELIAGLQRTLTQNEAALYNKTPDNSRKILTDYYTELADIEQVLVDARALQAELAGAGSAGAAAWARALAFIGIQNRAFGVEDAQLEVALSGEAPTTRLEDLTQLIQVLEDKVEDVRAAIEQMERELFAFDVNDTSLAAGNPLEQHIQSLTEEMIALQSQLEAERARQRELTEARDLAWETYQTLARKLSETEVAMQVPGSEVRFAVPALEPERPMARGRSMNTAVAAMLGLMVGVFGAFVVEWWRQETPVAPPPLPEAATD